MEYKQPKVFISPMLSIVCPLWKPSIVIFTFVEEEFYFKGRKIGKILKFRKGKLNEL